MEEPSLISIEASEINAWTAFMSSVRGTPVDGQKRRENRHHKYVTNGSTCQAILFVAYCANSAQIRTMQSALKDLTARKQGHSDIDYNLRSNQDRYGSE